jgi:hypothetical protein
MPSCHPVSSRLTACLVMEGQHTHTLALTSFITNGNKLFTTDQELNTKILIFTMTKNVPRVVPSSTNASSQLRAVPSPWWAHQPRIQVTISLPFPSHPPLPLQPTLNNSNILPSFVHAHRQTHPAIPAIAQARTHRGPSVLPQSQPYPGLRGSATWQCGATAQQHPPEFNGSFARLGGSRRGSADCCSDFGIGNSSSGRSILHHSRSTLLHPPRAPPPRLL